MSLRAGCCAADQMSDTRVQPGLLGWIGLTKEEPVDPGRRILDAHHHLHRRDGERYVLEDLLVDTTAGHNVTETVVVEGKYGYRVEGPEAYRPVGETAFLAAQAKRSEVTPTRIAAIVAFADLTLGDALQDVLDAHSSSSDQRMRGIRHATTWDADPAVPRCHHQPRRSGLLGETTFRQGIRTLQQNALVYDAWLYHPQLPELAELARAVPDARIVVNHLGAPLNVGTYTDRREVRKAWQKGMHLLRDCPNVTVKLGGIGQDRALFRTGWSEREQPPGSDEVAAWWGDDIRWCIDTFGPGRCMFESNYPVDRQSIGYTVLWNAFQKMASVYTDVEQDQLFSGTAADVYRISLGEEGEDHDSRNRT